MKSCSVVCYGEEGVIVGAEAKAGAIIYPENTVISVKRFMGQSEKKSRKHGKAS